MLCRAYIKFLGDCYFSTPKLMSPFLSCCFDLHGSDSRYSEQEARKKVSILQQNWLLFEKGKYFDGLIAQQPSTSKSFIQLKMATLLSVNFVKLSQCTFGYVRLCNVQKRGRWVGSPDHLLLLCLAVDRPWLAMGGPILTQVT